MTNSTAVRPEATEDTGHENRKLEDSIAVENLVKELKTIEEKDNLIQELVFRIGRLLKEIDNVKKIEGILKQQYQKHQISSEGKNRLELEYDRKLQDLRTELNQSIVEGEEYLFKQKYDVGVSLKDPKPYKANPLMVFTYDTLSKYKPINYFAITLICLLINLIPNAYFGTLYIQGERIGMLESGTMFSILVIPPAFILMDIVYHRFKTSFERLRIVVDVSDEQYQEFLKKNNRLLTDKKLVCLFSVILIVGTVIFGILNGIVNPGRYESTGLFDNFSIRVAIELPYIITWTFLYVIATSIVIHIVTITIIIRRFCKLPLRLRPVDPEGAGGLRPLADVALAISVAPLLGFVIIGYYVINSALIGQPITLRVVVAMAIITATMITAFFFPLTKAHEAMARDKNRLLRTLSKKHNQVYLRIINEIKSPDESVSPESFVALENIGKLYNKAEKMPVWPFDITIVIKLLTSITLPLLIIFGGELIIRLVSS